MMLPLVFRLLVALLCFCCDAHAFLSILKDIKEGVDMIAGVIIESVELDTRIACRTGLTCRGCGHGSCIESEGKAADYCCMDNFEYKCCASPLPAELGFQQRCQYEESKCPCGWGACIKRQAWVGGGCCGKGFEFRCCESESIVEWDRARTTDLVEYMKAKEECADVTSMCMCGFSRAEDKIMGMCCDDGSCLCCGKVLREHYDTESCAEKLKCTIDKSSPGCLETLSCVNYCVWAEGYKESECCRENYTLSCWTWAPRPTKLILSSEECQDHYQVAMSKKLVNDFNDADKFCASHAYKVSSKFVKTIEAQAKGEVIESSALYLIFNANYIFGCFVFWAYAVMW